MAKLSKYSAPGDWNWNKDREPNYPAFMERVDKELDVLRKESDSLPEGKIVGALVSWPVGDGQAVYRVSIEKPLTLQHVPYGDAWHLPDAHIRGLTKEDILKKIAGRKAMKEMFSK